MRKAIALLLVLLGLLNSCSQHPQPYRDRLYVFGTLVEITLYADSPQQAQQALAAIHSGFREFHRQWHAWRPGGIVMRINQAIAAGQCIDVPASVKGFILKSQTLTRASGGLFDPGIGWLVDLWGFHGEVFTGPPPAEAHIQQWRQQRPSLLHIYFKGNNLCSHHRQVHLDFGANAKGLALDLAIDLLQQADIQHAIVNIGGDMKTLGAKPNGQPWRIGVQDPFNPDQLIAQVTLNGGEALVTSGTYQRYFNWQGIRYSHILDPTTGWPAHGLVSVTVLHPDATTADAAATALLVAGPERWRAVATQMGIDYAAVIDQTGQLSLTPAMQQRWHKLSQRGSP